MVEIMPEANLGLMKCQAEKEHMNATIMCIETDYAFLSNHLPTLRQISWYVKARQSAGIIKE